MRVAAKNGTLISSVENSLRNAISTLIKDFRTEPREETAWVRALVDRAELPAEGRFESQIEKKILFYCPEVPETYLPFVVDVLAASIRLARRDKTRLELSPVKRIIRLETIPRMA